MASSLVITLQESWSGEEKPVQLPFGLDPSENEDSLALLQKAALDLTNAPSEYFVSHQPLDPSDTSNDIRLEVYTRIPPGRMFYALEDSQCDFCGTRLLNYKQLNCPGCCQFGKICDRCQFGPVTHLPANQPWEAVLRSEFPNGLYRHGRRRTRRSGTKICTRLLHPWSDESRVSSSLVFCGDCTISLLVRASVPLPAFSKQELKWLWRMRTLELAWAAEAIFASSQCLKCTEGLCEIQWHPQLRLSLTSDEALESVNQLFTAQFDQILLPRFLKHAGC